MRVLPAFMDKKAACLIQGKRPEGSIFSEKGSHRIMLPLYFALYERTLT